MFHIQGQSIYISMPQQEMVNPGGVMSIYECWRVLSIPTVNGREMVALQNICQAHRVSVWNVIDSVVQVVPKSTSLLLLLFCTVIVSKLVATNAVH